MRNSRGERKLRERESTSRDAGEATSGKRRQEREKLRPTFWNKEGALEKGGERG
jgi:hypothetical protein